MTTLVLVRHVLEGKSCRLIRLTCISIAVMLLFDSLKVWNNSHLRCLLLSKHHKVSNLVQDRRLLVGSLLLLCLLLIDLTKRKVEAQHLFFVPSKFKDEKQVLLACQLTLNLHESRIIHLLSCKSRQLLPICIKRLFLVRLDACFVFLPFEELVKQFKVFLG